VCAPRRGGSCSLRGRCDLYYSLLQCVQSDDGHHEGPKHVVVALLTSLAIKVYTVVFMAVFHIHFLHCNLIHNGDIAPQNRFITSDYIMIYVRIPYYLHCLERTPWQLREQT
jgi:hypothetical protein